MDVTLIGECVAAEIINPVKVDTTVNVSDFLTKSLDWKSLHYHSGSFFGRWELGKEVDRGTSSSAKLKSE